MPGEKVVEQIVQVPEVEMVEVTVKGMSYTYAELRGKGTSPSLADWSRGSRSRRLSMPKAQVTNKVVKAPIIRIHITTKTHTDAENDVQSCMGGDVHHLC